MITRRQFLMTSGALFLAGCAGRARVLPSTPGSLDSTVRLHVPRSKHFRILQLTDLHFFSNREFQANSGRVMTRDIIDAVIRKTKPDLLLITGDTWPANRQPRTGEIQMRRAIPILEGFGLPWAYTWGNHDQLANMDEGHQTLAEAKNSLYRGAKTNGNYVIDLVGKRDKTLWQLLCVNTGEDGFLEEQRQWVRSLPPASVPRLAFFHIPLKQYADVWNNGTASGVIGENPCIEKEDGGALPVLKEAGVRACFCGHDHVNDYSGMCDGIELVYGRATGLGGYGRELVPKGGKLITVDCLNGTYSWVSVLPDGTRWFPKPGERKDVRKPEDRH